MADRSAWLSILRGCGFHGLEQADVERVIEKDLWVTETIRHALAPLQRYPDVPVVFKGGTALAKAWKIVRRFSEDVDAMGAPAPDRPFGSKRRKRLRRDFRDRLRSKLDIQVDERQAGDLAKFACRYPSRCPNLEGRPPEVLVDLVTRRLNRDWIETCRVQSIAGVYADTETRERYSFLSDFGVPAAHPMITLIDKLSALHGRSISTHPADVARRVRDLYDIPFLLRCEPIASRITSGVVAQLHAETLAALPPALRAKDAPRPRWGFAASPAFQPGHPAYEALRAAYPTMASMIFDDGAWLPFEAALRIIHDHAEVL